MSYLNIPNLSKTLESLPPHPYTFPLDPFQQHAISAIAKDHLTGLGNVRVISPLNYAHFIFLLSRCRVAITDSGGIQEEAPSLGKPVLLMRDITERPESLESGTVTLVGTNQQNIVAGVSRLLEDSFYYQTMSLVHNPYGTGQACKLIVDILKKT